MTRMPFAVLIAISCLAGCAVAPEEEQAPPVASEESSLRVDCSAVLCIAVVCGEGEIAKIPNGQCCPICVKAGKPDCRSKGCATGQYCAECKTTSGSGFVCLPNNSAC